MCSKIIESISKVFDSFKTKISVMCAEFKSEISVICAEI